MKYLMYSRTQSDIIAQQVVDADCCVGGSTAMSLAYKVPIFIADQAAVGNNYVALDSRGILSLPKRLVPKTFGVNAKSPTVDFNLTNSQYFYRLTVNFHEDAQGLNGISMRLVLYTVSGNSVAYSSPITAVNGKMDGTTIRRNYSGLVNVFNGLVIITVPLYIDNNQIRFAQVVINNADKSTVFQTVFPTSSELELLPDSTVLNFYPASETDEFKFSYDNQVISKLTEAALSKAKYVCC